MNKLAIFILAATALNCSEQIPLPNPGNLATIFPPRAGDIATIFPPRAGNVQVSNKFSQLLGENVGNKYDVCIDQFEPLFHQLIVITHLCANGRSRETLPLTLQFVRDTANTLRCFEDARSQKLKVFGLDPECVIDHLNKASSILRLIVQDLQRQDWENIQRHFHMLMDTLADIKNC